MDHNQHQELKTYPGVGFEDALNLLNLSRKDMAIDARPASHSNDESTQHKLLRTSHLLAAGLASGSVERSVDLLLKNPAEGAGLFLGTLALGYGLTALSESGGKLAVAARYTNYLLRAGIAIDLTNRGAAAAPAFADNWKSAQNYESNKSIVGHSLGSAITDYSLMAAGGISGALARKTQAAYFNSRHSQTQEFPKITTEHYWPKYSNAFYDGRKIHFYSPGSSEPYLLPHADLKSVAPLTPILPTSFLQQEKSKH
ncbi:MAG: hypothetical protein K2X77_24080 [Candidatus Obscuribacterales bacterium]|nr:hypothetical protein [Candidatus Obscuribacterales bacterium]